jgi:O-acetyl-ADP-ribose deacetylase (regulator of RNase III)
MIRWAQGSIFDSGADALVCPVNCQGVMGAGLAREFARRFFGLADDFRRTVILPGRCGIWCFMNHTVILLPTKDHWRDPSPLWMIYAGLGSMLSILHDNPGLKSVAIPALGCGLGGLSWSLVRPMTLRACAMMHDREFILYAPKDFR